MLFGAHAFYLHPFLVAVAWHKLYGFPWDIRLWLACFLHDIGYAGKPNLDGPEGETHPYLGARIMGWLFDKHYPEYWPMAERNRTWYNFTLRHSRSLCRQLDVPFSKLCVADKLVPAITPWWLYIPFVVATGEIKEYQQGVVDGYRRGSKNINEQWYLDSMAAVQRNELYWHKRWFQGMQSYMRKWVEENKYNAYE